MHLSFISNPQGHKVTALSSSGGNLQNPRGYSDWLGGREAVAMVVNYFIHRNFSQETQLSDRLTNRQATGINSDFGYARQSSLIAPPEQKSGRYRLNTVPIQD